MRDQCPDNEEHFRSGTPQPVVFLEITTTSRHINFLPRFCVEKKFYPVPSGTRRYQPVRSGTIQPSEPLQSRECAHDPETGQNASACALLSWRTTMREAHVPYWAPNSWRAWEAIGRVRAGVILALRLSTPNHQLFSPGPTTRQYPAIPGNTRTEAQFLAAYCRILPHIAAYCRILPRKPIFLPRKTA
jgi:hypothetical protein